MKVELECEEGDDGKLYFFVLNGMVHPKRLLIKVIDIGEPEEISYRTLKGDIKRRAIQ